MEGMEKYGVFLALKHLQDDCKLKVTKLIHDDDASVRSLIQKVFIDIEEQLCVGKRITFQSDTLGHGCKKFHSKMKARSVKVKELVPYTMPATIALRWCFTSCNGDVQVLKQLMDMMRKHFEGDHSKCTHPFKDKCQETKIKSDHAKQVFKVLYCFYFTEQLSETVE